MISHKNTILKATTIIVFLLVLQINIAQLPITNLTYQYGIKPNNCSQKEMNVAVCSFYQQWRRYLIKDHNSDRLYVKFDEEQKSGRKWASEGHGYGMLITVLMSEQISTAHATYDSLCRFYLAHLSHFSSDLDDATNKVLPNKYPYLMIDASNSSDGGSATDGDMDIAYSLLCASAKWGNNGALPYTTMANNLLSAIKDQEINYTTKTVLLGNTSKNERNKKGYNSYNDMRASDFMPSHLHLFKTVDVTYNWEDIVNACYASIELMQHKYSPNAGLIPDFIHEVQKPIPMNKQTAIKADLSDEDTPSSFGYNACRVPWRIATDYLIYGDARSKSIVHKMNSFMKEKTKNNPDLIVEGYKLNGDELRDKSNSLLFVAPLAVAAMAEDATQSNQEWLNKLWMNVMNQSIEDKSYFKSSIKMISMIILSGNYKVPIDKVTTMH